MPATAAGRPAGTRWWPAGLAWALAALTVVSELAAASLDRLLREAGQPDLIAIPASGIPLVVAAVSAVAVGAVLAVRRSRHPVGWLLLVLGLSQGLRDLSFSYTRYGLVARPGSLPAAGYLAGLNNGLALSGIACAGFVLLLTPTGRLPSPRWRWWARVAAAAALVWLLGSIIDPMPLYPEYPDIPNPLGVPVLFGPLKALAFVAVVVLAALVVGAVLLVLRFRRARGTERLQLRWLGWGAAIAAVALLVAVAALVMDDSGSNLLNLALGVSAAVLPLATGAAILRYRLYDLDRIISRTLAYGLLTLLLGRPTPGWCLAWAGCCPRAPAWWWPGPPWPWRRCSSRPAGASSRWWTGASTAAATTPPRRSPASAPTCGTRSTWPA